MSMEVRATIVLRWADECRKKALSVFHDLLEAHKIFLNLTLRYVAEKFGHDILNSP